MIVKSFAGTGRDYVAAQATTLGYPPGTVHVQVVGESGSESNPKGNREYGYAGTFGVEAAVAEFIKGLEGTNGISLAKTGKEYTAVQIRPRGGVIHFQVKGKGMKAPAWLVKAAEVVPAPYFVDLAASVPFETVTGNREYGMAFDIPREGNEEFWTFLAESIIFAQ